MDCSKIIGSGSHKLNAPAKQVLRVEICSDTLMRAGTSNGFRRNGEAASLPTVKISRSSRNSGSSLNARYSVLAGSRTMNGTRWSAHNCLSNEKQSEVFPDPGV